MQEVCGNTAQIIGKDLVKADQFDLWHLRCESNNIVTLIKMARDMGIVRDRRCSAQHTGVSMKRARARGFIIHIFMPRSYHISF